MKLRMMVAVILVLAGVGLMVAAPPQSTGLVVHEWGTFLAMNGSDGVSLDGMYHEEHALPAFVHSRSKDQLKLPSVIIKGETPVIYFYTKESRRVSVRVDFPGGVWTQWYPQASLVGPGLVQGTPLRPHGGYIQWALDLIPPGAGQPQQPEVAADALWRYARDVDAAYVRGIDQARTGNPEEWERFIFYRGLGEAPLPARLHAGNGQIAIHADGSDMRHVFVVRVEHGRGAFTYVPGILSGESVNATVPDLEGGSRVEDCAEALADQVARRLVDSGLFEQEARAMVNTWRSSWFESDGVRVLFVLPQAWTDRYIPLRVTPAPDRTVRVMVGRVELLTPAREQEAEAAVRDLASPDAATRERAFATLRSGGRYVEPIVRRVLRSSTDARVQMLSRRLLLTDFVTELKTALTPAVTLGQAQDPLYVRAQLASLLREIGLAEEARQEGEAALADLARRPAPVMTRDDSRHMYRALARANEGAGRDREALRWYGEFVKFGSQSTSCANCHVLEGPRTMAFYRDWWAGEKFAAYAVSTGEAPALIAAHEAALAGNSHDAAARLSLAYLYTATGQPERAGVLWDVIDPPSRAAEQAAAAR